MIDRIAQYELEMPLEPSQEDNGLKDEMKYELENGKEILSSEEELGIGNRASLGSGLRAKLREVTEIKRDRRQTSTKQKRKKDLDEDDEKFVHIDDRNDVSTEKKKRKYNRKTPEMRKALDLARGENGELLLPVKLGPLTLLQLGTIIFDREKFHNKRYIWPVGFESTRSYFSMKTPDQHTIYTSRILDGGDGPLFQVTAEDDPENPVAAPAASTTWTTIVRKVNEAKNKGQMCSASGPEYFGFGNPTIARLIQEMPNADKCKNYVMQPFQIVKDHPIPAATQVAPQEHLNDDVVFPNGSDEKNDSASHEIQTFREPAHTEQSEMSVEMNSNPVIEQPAGQSSSTESESLTSF